MSDGEDDAMVRGGSEMLKGRTKVRSWGGNGGADSNLREKWREYRQKVSH